MTEVLFLPHFPVRKLELRNEVTYLRSHTGNHGARTHTRSGLAHLLTKNTDPAPGNTPLAPGLQVGPDTFHSALQQVFAESTLGVQVRSGH